jgi:hypothetical protein
VTERPPAFCQCQVPAFDPGGISASAHQQPTAKDRGRGRGPPSKDRAICPLAPVRGPSATPTPARRQVCFPIGDPRRAPGPTRPPEASRGPRRCHGGHPARGRRRGSGAGGRLPGPRRAVKHRSATSASGAAMLAAWRQAQRPRPSGPMTASSFRRPMTHVIEGRGTAAAVPQAHQRC